MCAEPPPRGRVVRDQKDSYPVEEGDRQPELWSVSARTDVLEGRVGSRDLAKDHNNDTTKTHHRAVMGLSLPVSSLGRQELSCCVAAET